MPYIGNPPAERFTSFAYQDLTGGSGTSFTLDNAVGNPQEIEVFVNNVRQEPGVAYTVSGTALTMTGSIASTDDFYVVFQGKAIQTATHPSDRALTATDGTFTGNTSVTGNSTVTGNLTVDTTTLHVDAANNRVGIGTASPSVDLEIASTAGSIKLSDTDGSDKETIIKHSGGTFFLQARDGSSNAPIVFGGNGGGSFDEHLRVLSGGGLTFNGDTATANALDDYEEGTWTPEFGGSTSDGTFTYSVQNGRYTKVGRQVTFSAHIQTSSGATGGSGTLQIKGLPYTAAAVSSFWFSSYIGYFNQLSSYGNSANDLKLLGPIQNGTMLRFHAFDNAGEGGTNPNQGHIQNGSIIFFGGAYDIG